MKNIAYLLLFFLLTSANTAVQASTLAGGSGWRVASTVSNGVGVTVNGVKDVIVNGAKKTVTGVANVTPTASQVGKFMSKNLGAAAVVGAMDLLLDGVDYVLDPANNSIRYKVDSERTLICGTTDCVYRIDKIGSFASPQEACSAFFKSVGGSGSAVWDDWRNDSKMSCVGKAANGAYAGVRVYHTIPTTETDQEEKTIPLVNLGSRVLEQAETEVKTGNPAVPIATPVTQAAATAVVGEAATDDVQARPIVTELDKSTTYPTTEDATGTVDTPAVTDPVTGEVVKPAESSSIKLSFPKACEWFPQACVFFDWVMAEPEDDSQELPEHELEKKEIDKDLLNIGGSSCPQDLTVNWSGLPFGITINESFEMQPYCDELEPLKYVFILITTCLCAFMFVRL